ncbi:right-handed parallel beta-helix repeat-containing protein [uncultured Croceitalea sp.]|uniref:right-handed parallel beta-helix repeat-containing protein n=1 Tax=uncultured Croceitalea sp. TaxID=1798908 RepID=UPI003305EB19
MKKSILFFSLFLFCIVRLSFCQEIYVNAVTGNDSNDGGEKQPFKSISKAVGHANSLTGAGSISIKVFPGIYALDDRVDVNPVRVMTDSTRFSIEAVHMPNDTDWSQEKMPKILSVSDNNSETIFPHSLGFLVAAPHVTFKGLKFLGNGNPLAQYYYPIAKEDESLEDLEISQCYFIGNKEAAAIQGAIYAHGPKTKISNCVFYECRNAILLFNNVAGFSVERSIITKSYESAFWLGPDDMPFTFNNNVVVDNNNFIVGRSADLKYASALNNSIVANNNGYVGYWSREDQKIVPISKPDVNDNRVVRKAKVVLLENNSVQLPKRHLHLNEGSDGTALKSGIFSRY